MELVEAPWTVLTHSALHMIWFEFRMRVEKDFTPEQQESRRAWVAQTQMEYGVEFDNHWPGWEETIGLSDDAWRHVPEPARMVPNEGSPGDWLTLRQAAWRSGVDYETLGLWTRTGRLASVKLGRLRFIHASALVGLAASPAAVQQPYSTAVRLPAGEYASLTPSLRFAVLMRDHFTCRYCGAAAPHVRLHIDHVKPRAAGGVHRLDNLVTACERCNLGKYVTVLEAAPSVMPGPSPHGCVV